MNGAGRPMAQGRSCRLALALRFSLAAAMLLGITAAIFAARSVSVQHPRQNDYIIVLQALTECGQGASAVALDIKRRRPQ